MSCQPRQSFIADIPRVGWQALATVGIWLGVGIACAIAPANGHEVAGAGAISTVVVWIFG